jgi:hypothetical protein
MFIKRERMRKKGGGQGEGEGERERESEIFNRYTVPFHMMLVPTWSSL